MQFDISNYLLPFIRDNTAANHDFSMQVEATGVDTAYAKIFVVDYYQKIEN